MPVKSRCNQKRLAPSNWNRVEQSVLSIERIDEVAEGAALNCPSNQGVI